MALLLCVGIACYANSFTVPFVLDDFYTIDYFGTQNLVNTLLHGSVRRIADVTFTLNYRLHGVEVFGYHLTNLCIHLVTSLLLYVLLESALSALRSSYPTHDTPAQTTWSAANIIPCATALLFVCHPIQTQAVTYIIQRYTSLASCFYLLSTWLFIRARLAVIHNNSHPWRFAFGTALAGILAIGCKQTAATLPLMLLFLEVFLFRSRLLKRRFYLIGAGVTVAAILVLAALPHDIMQALQQATTEDVQLSRSTYFFTQIRVVATYLRLLCLPLGQSLIHDPQMYTSLLAIPVLCAGILHLFIIAMALLLFKTSGQNLTSSEPRGIYQRLISLGIFWFYCALIVESSFFPIRDALNEHRLYLPSAGFMLSVTALFAWAGHEKRSWIKPMVLLFAVLCGTLGFMTIKRNQVWQNPLALWEEAANTAPRRWLALANLANEYSRHNMPSQALSFYLRAIELNPELFFRAKIGLGVALQQLHAYDFRHTTGEEYIGTGGKLGSGVIAASDKQKWDAVIFNNMGLAYEYEQNVVKAKAAYQAALMANPVYDLAWLNCALLAARTGEPEQAAQALRRLHTLNSKMAEELAVILNSAVLR